MTKHWSDDIPVDEDALVDPKEVEAINRTIAHFAATAKEYAKKNDTSSTLRTVKAALDIVRSVFTLRPSEAEALQQQVDRAVRGRTALPAAQPESSSQQLQPYTGGQPPAVVQGANAALQRYVLSLFTLTGVEVQLSHSGQLDTNMLQGLFLKAQQNVHGLQSQLEAATRELHELQQQSSPRYLGSPNPPPVDPATGPIPAGDFIPRTELGDILTEIDEARSHGDGDASKLGLIHPSGMMGIGSPIDADDRKDREEFLKAALDKLYQLGHPNSRNRSRLPQRRRPGGHGHN